MASSRTAKRSVWPRLVVYLLVLVIGGLGILKQQDIRDWWSLRDYTAPAAVESLVSQTTMNDYGRKLFLVNHPQIQDKAQFYTSCEENETTVVLGCYKPGNGIYLLQVTDERLNGIEQVTAAHEMLHAAYQRLSDSKKKDINAQLLDFYNTTTDEQVKAKIEEYKKIDADIANELHSILGTELAELTPQLETYYRTYFRNRGQLAVYAKQYWSEFSSRQKKVQDYDAQLAELEATVMANNATLDAQQASLNAESAELDRLLRNNEIAAYNAGVGVYNQKLPAYRALIAQTKQLVADYRSILEARNQVAIEAQELNKALDSRITTTAEDK